jgi:hypothetical protein
VEALFSNCATLPGIKHLFSKGILIALRNELINACATVLSPGRLPERDRACPAVGLGEKRLSWRMYLDL